MTTHNFTIQGKNISLYSVKNDSYGNPRKVVHWLSFFADDEEEKEYAEAYKRAKKLGFRVYHGKDFGGGFVCQCSNPKTLAEEIINSYPQVEAV